MVNVLFSPAHAVIPLNEMTVSYHSLCASAVHLLTSLLPDPLISLSVLVSHLSLFDLWGQVMNGFRALIG